MQDDEGEPDTPPGTEEVVEADANMAAAAQPPNTRDTGPLSGIPTQETPMKPRYTSQHWGKPDAYRIPDDGFFRIINFSGGRSSAFMLRRILDAHHGTLPPRTRVVFTNTGKEREETLIFVNQIERRWRVPIVWLEYVSNAQAQGGASNPKRTYRVVCYETASRNGEPFAALNQARGMLPTAGTRACTAELKVSTTDRFARRSLGWPKKQTRNVLGIRYDEPRRWQEAILIQCRTEYPMVHARVSKADVHDY